jgi:hypothetical protein
MILLLIMHYNFKILVDLVYWLFSWSLQSRVAIQEVCEGVFFFGNKLVTLVTFRAINIHKQSGHHSSQLPREKENAHPVDPCGREDANLTPLGRECTNCRSKIAITYLYISIILPPLGFGALCNQLSIFGFRCNWFNYLYSLNFFKEDAYNNVSTIYCHPCQKKKENVQIRREHKTERGMVFRAGYMSSDKLD